MKFKTLLIVPLLVASLQAASVSDLTFTVASEVGPPPLGDSTEYSVTSCRTNASGSLNIPSTYNGLPVTSIASMAFINCTNLTSITIPDSVAFIGGNAFENCTSLTSINIPDNVSSIEGGTFKGCTSLASITIPEGVTFGYGGGAFENCTSLTSINIPDSVTSIESRTFSGCTSLVSVTMPDGVPFIGAPHFTNGDYIGYEAFSNCTSLTSITIPAGVTDIGGGAFSNCISLTSITVPDDLVYINDSAFSNCTSLTSITLPDRVYYIAGGAFNNCISLASINIPDGVTSIGYAAFSHCSSLTSITIPDSVTSIGQNAFSHCSSLASITFNGNAPTAGGLLFVDIPSDAIISYYAYATGFSSPTWQGVDTRVNIPRPPILELETYYESNSGERITIDATPTDGSPTNYTYTWMFNGMPASDLYGFSDPYQNPTYTLGGSLSSEGTWAVSVANTGNSTYAEFEYRVFTDADSDGLSDYRESNILYTDPNLADSDSDGLIDFAEVYTHSTNPNVNDTDSDGLSDGDEVNTYTSNPLAPDTSGDGFSDGFVVTQGADPSLDYSAFRTETVNQIKDARIGSTMIEVSDGKADITMTLEETSDLSDWSSATSSEKIIEIDAPAGTRFYRFKMTE